MFQSSKHSLDFVMLLRIVFTSMLIGASLTNYGCLSRSGISSTSYELKQAIKSSDYRKVEQLLSTQDIANVMVQVGSTERLSERPLHLACANGDIEMVALLLKYGARPDCVARDGRPPAFCVAYLADEGKATKILEALVDNGYDIDMVDNSDGRTVLMWAILFERPRVVEWLLKKGANVGLRDKSGNDAKMIVDVRSLAEDRDQDKLGKIGSVLERYSGK